MSEGAGAGAGAEGGAVADVSSASVDAGAVAGEGVSAEVAELLALDADGSRNVKVTVDGEEMTLPLNEVLGGYQRARASNKRFEEASKIRKQAELSSRDAQTILDALGGEDLSRFERLLAASGADQKLEQLMHRKIQERLQYEAMTDDERARYDFDREREAFEKERERHKETRLEAQTRHAQTQIMGQFSKTLEAHGIKRGDADFPFYVQHMAQHALEAHQAGVQVNPQECFELVERERSARDRRRVQGLDAEGLIGLLGEETLAKLRQADLARLKRDAPSKPSRTRGKPKPKAKAKTMTPDQFRDELLKRRGW